MKIKNQIKKVLESGGSIKARRRKTFEYRRQLATDLSYWFAISGSDRERWSKDPVGQIIKQELLKINNWKKSRSKKGFAKVYNAAIVKK